jgi:hypothetical protein
VQLGALNYALEESKVESDSIGKKAEWSITGRVCFPRMGNYGRPCLTTAAAGHPGEEVRKYGTKYIPPVINADPSRGCWLNMSQSL